MTNYFEFDTQTRRGYLNITGQVGEIVKRSGVQEGLCLVNAMHITAGVYVNDDEFGLLSDYDEQIFYAEFDGRRRKRVLVKVIGE